MHIISAQHARERLIEGNLRFAGSQPANPRQDRIRREQIASSQNPFAIILGCADSRVPPEILFDQGLGDLFVVRNAGHVVDRFVTASIEYAVGHLGVKLVVVLGHSGCGAVTAAVKNQSAQGALSELLGNIVLSMEGLKRETDLIECTIKAHAQRMALQLIKSEPVLKEQVQQEQVLIIPAVYDLQSGLVTFLDQPAP